ncbi:hypothetical protein [Shimia sp.]|uniref:hypothetical protein n=1 Tax=Shimia sp. TaxID=1954381 RepID=UPI003B8AAFE5
MRLSLCAVTLAALVACSDGGGGFVTMTGVRVNSVNADVFEVIARPDNEVNQLWCGAGEYARRALGAAVNDRVYVVSGGGPAVTTKAPSSAQFSLKPPAQVTGATGHKSYWGPRVGRSKFVADASSSCGLQAGQFPL